MYGAPDYYMKTGKMSFIAKRIEPFGRGKLYMELEALRKKLEAEGLFSETHKRSAPAFVFDLAVVTSAEGAVIKDICSTVRKYNGVINIAVIDVQVQGKNAVKEIVDGLRLADMGGFDAVILARGGGSFEDLMPFNSEEVVRALYDMNTFVISAVGHETDFTLADFAADMRALTPTAAAEAVTFDVRELKKDIVSDISRAGKHLKNALTERRAATVNLAGRVTYAVGKMFSGLLSSVDKLLAAAKRGAERSIGDKEKRLDGALSKLDALSPVKLLKAGYMRAEKAGRPVASAGDLARGDEIKLYASFGRISATVGEIVLNEEV